MALEGQLSLDDQPAFHEAVTLAQRQGAQALASLGARLAVEAIPLLHFPQHSTAAALCEMRPLLRPAAVLFCRESRLFADWPLAADNFPRMFSDFRRRLERSADPPLPPPDLRGLVGAAQHWPAAWLQPPPAGPAGVSGPSLGPPPDAHPCDPRSAFPFSGDEPSALARLQRYFSIPMVCGITRPAEMLADRHISAARFTRQPAAECDGWLIVIALAAQPLRTRPGPAFGGP